MARSWPYMTGGLVCDCRLSRSLGYAGRVCIHPDQVAEANRIYAPDPADVEFARKATAAFDEAECRGSASIAVDGVFIDYPIVHKARRIIRLAEAIARRESGRRRDGEPGSEQSNQSEGGRSDVYAVQRGEGPGT
jgi:citrate lyase subunit beta/citryl-CoA lyase